MPAAVRTDSVLTTLPITTLSLLTATQTALANAGFPVAVFDDNKAAGNYVIYEIVLNSTATKGKVYFRLGASMVGTLISMSQSILDTWNSTTDVGTNASAVSSSANINPNAVVNFAAFRHPEMILVMVYQSATVNMLVGYVRPATKYSWWNEDEAPFCFVPDANGWVNYPCANINPFGSTTEAYNLATYDSMVNRNRKSGRRDLKPSPDVKSPYTEGITATYSADVCIGATNGTARLDTITVSPTEIYTILSGSTGNGLCLRTT